jgi:hypothetical protein
MSLLSLILETLKTPDAQKRDWYGWVTNQTGHFTIGVLITAIAIQVLPLYFSILPAVVFAGLKESTDLLRGGALKDSFVDWTFQCVGAFFCIVLSIKNFDLVNLSVGFIILSLVFGLIPRLKKLFVVNRK